MATIKSYTDLEQAKALAKILPIESADMCWKYQKDRWVDEPDYNEFPQFEHATDKRDIPCWSLAALISVLPNYQLQTQDDGIGVLCSCNGKFNIVTADNPIDACYEMIIRLHELNLL